MGTQGRVLVHCERAQECVQCGVCLGVQECVPVCVTVYAGGSGLV